MSSRISESISEKFGIGKENISTAVTFDTSDTTSVKIVSTVVTVNERISDIKNEIIAYVKELTNSEICVVKERS